MYSNENGKMILVWSSDEMDVTHSVAWGDWDGDGTLDLAVGNWQESNRVYANKNGTLNLAWSSTETDLTDSIAWGDWDGDGTLDLAVGNSGYSSGSPNRVYANEGEHLNLAWTSDELDKTTSIAWGDWDGDGDLRSRCR